MRLIFKLLASCLPPTSRLVVYLPFRITFRSMLLTHVKVAIFIGFHLEFISDSYVFGVTLFNHVSIHFL